MGAVEEGGKVATAAVESLKSQPLALALVLVNVLFLCAGLYAVHDIAGAVRGREERRDALLLEFAERCILPSAPNHR